MFGDDRTVIGMNELFLTKLLLRGPGSKHGNFGGVGRGMFVHVCRGRADTRRCNG